ncbi:hypothetical protein [Flagellimonas abyssi]|uniref:Uncharacterized protein n=1 Tax=Flagellimonas abyssi TaxID=2864871 RepID=A0ABS7ELA4_9FLAO|nr:hypothetical protein [Allomuricauda abyssi]MBC74034.1 hypothetical protein [Allomuricauda sp.]MBW8198342.1 hypothetical protein [Allomuricauda abyssi]|tara:strand:+ start:312 stop:539 length:228 start_codon:yes stop_codon:yes gene_type:complete
MSLKPNNLLPLLSYFEECHEGDLLSLTQWLDKAIYMFHYLSTDIFSEIERQNVCHVLMELKEAVLKIHVEQNNCA